MAEDSARDLDARHRIAAVLMPLDSRILLLATATFEQAVRILFYLIYQDRSTLLDATTLQASRLASFL